MRSTSPARDTSPIRVGSPLRSSSPGPSAMRLTQQQQQQRVASTGVGQDHHQAGWAGSGVGSKEGAFFELEVADAIMRYHYYIENGIDPRHVAPYR